MNEFSLYLLKVSARLTIFYLFYIASIRNLNCSQWNRAFLLSSSIFSLLIPILKNPWQIESDSALQQILFSTINNSDNTILVDTK